jgi:uncharacterized iron-regulated membrane protein
MKLRRFVELAHLWLGLILGAQVVLWMASGVVMSFFDIALVRGETNAAANYAIELEAHNYSNPGGVIVQTPGASKLTLRHFLGKPVWEVEGAEGSALFDADTGEQISPIKAEQARAVAKRDFVGEAEIEATELLNAPPHEYRGDAPVWRVSFKDKLETRIYISPQTGEIEARRNKIWRLYDFFWMLHIMDYKERENFNNPLVKTVSATALLFSLTGVFLVVTSFARGRHRLPRRRPSVGALSPALESKSPPVAGSSDIARPKP